MIIDTGHMCKTCGTKVLAGTAPAGWAAWCQSLDCATVSGCETMEAAVAYREAQHSVVKP
jgi:hypothetical protein